MMEIDRLVNDRIQAMLTPGAPTFLSTFIRGILGPMRYSEPVLDVGCRFHSLLVESGLRPVGVSIPPLGRRRSGADAVADPASLPFPDRTFPAVFGMGFLNYLPDHTARRAISEMMRVGRREGIVVVFAGINSDAPWRRPISSVIRKLDRGHYARSEREFRALFDGHLSWDCQRVTYALTGIEGVWLTSRGAD
jgi:SAM-dependent methyltransferase